MYFQGIVNTALRQAFFLNCLILLLCLHLPINANTRNRFGYDQEQVSALKEVREQLFDLRHTQNNHDQQIRILEDRLSTYESIMDSLRDDLEDTIAASKELLKNSSASVDAKVGSVEAMNKNIINDLKQFKTFSQESISSLDQARQRISDLERQLALQSQNIEHLQASVKALLDALQIKSPSSSRAIASTSPSTSKAPENGSNTYKIKAGDSLEKIARANGTTIKALCELNNLSGDKINKIREGQTLKLPEK